jgi:hypothetical protein
MLPISQWLHVMLQQQLPGPSTIGDAREAAAVEQDHRLHELGSSQHPAAFPALL